MYKIFQCNWVSLEISFVRCIWWRTIFQYSEVAMKLQCYELFWYTDAEFRVQWNHLTMKVKFWLEGKWSNPRHKKSIWKRNIHFSSRISARDSKKILANDIDMYIQRLMAQQIWTFCSDDGQMNESLDNLSKSLVVCYIFDIRFLFLNMSTLLFSWPSSEP